MHGVNLLESYIISGLFTYYFLKAIQDGNADINMDGQITVSEIYNYAADQVTRKARGLRNLDQHPTMQGDNQNNVIVTIKE